MRTLWTKRLEYWLKAKGRHGTHSPFAYGFVENVLRKPPIATANEDNKIAAILSRQDYQLLLRIICYLRPKQVMTHAALSALLQSDQLLLEMPSWIPMMQDELPQSVPPATLAVLDAAACSEVFLRSISAAIAPFSLVLYQPCQSKQTLALLGTVFNMPDFNLTIDCLRFAVLIKDPAFINRQHFILK